MGIDTEMPPESRPGVGEQGMMGGAGKGAISGPVPASAATCVIRDMHDAHGCTCQCFGRETRLNKFVLNMEGEGRRNYLAISGSFRQEPWEPQCPLYKCV